MKALTISQPYASLIASGEKFVENRRWETSYRGPLLIHAGKGTQYMDRDEMREGGYVTGAAVAVCLLGACLPLVSMRTLHRQCRIASIRDKTLTIGDVLGHAHTKGPWCWILTDVVRLREPIPCSGAQGLWTPSPEVLEAINQQFLATEAH